MNERVKRAQQTTFCFIWNWLMNRSVWLCKSKICLDRYRFISWLKVTGLTQFNIFFCRIVGINTSLFCYARCILRPPDLTYPRIFDGAFAPTVTMLQKEQIQIWITRDQGVRGCMLLNKQEIFNVCHPAKNSGQPVTLTDQWLDRADTSKFQLCQVVKLWNYQRI